MFSKYYGESSKLVSKMFIKIERMLDEEPNVFLCIFVDEIESLAGVRQHSAGSNEPKESMRAVNTLLVALDRLGRHQNVVVFLTSNLVQAIDPAILDRIDVKQYVPGPSTSIRYEMFRRCYFELLASNVVTPMSRGSDNEEIDVNGSAGNGLLESWQVIARANRTADELLPTYEVMELSFRTDTKSMPYKLLEIAEKSAGLSGRVLQRLPTQALAMHIRFDPCSIEEALEALSRMVDEQQLVLND
ncbi:MAG: hypothetical protein Q9207_003892 [Kuettlingeria erythrocarpa]